MSTPTLPARLADPDRTTAVLAILAEIDDLLEAFSSDLDRWFNGESQMAIVDARDKLIGLIQRLGTVRALGPPSQEAFAEAHRQIDER